MTAVLRLAMWSGPRNLSTALMRSWGSRADTAVSDEPFYAHYLQVSGEPHPGRKEILAAHETDWRRGIGLTTADLFDRHILARKQAALSDRERLGIGMNQSDASITA